MSDHTSAPLGVLMGAEMAEQPDVLGGMAARFDDVSAQLKGLVSGGVAGVAFLARGSSDNAALLGRYAVELASGLPTCLVAPSVVTSYQRGTDGFAGWLIVALSQSGRTPEIVRLAGDFHRSGATVVGITNDSDSDLAREARLTIELNAGRERAVPATKTVTSQMLAVLAIAAGLTSRGQRALTGADVSVLTGAVSELLDDVEPVQRVAAQLAAHNRVAVVGRGTIYPAALETALKLQETSGMMAHGFSTADFRHGPIAVCGPDVPAVLLAGSGPADEDTREVRAQLTQRGAPSILVGTASGRTTPDVAWPLLGTAAECVLATVRGQQLALHVCRALGIDPDQPAGLNKVTLTH
jgi:glucosamine--fructose-6-phosphate aminotransferase (isomerizing)